MAMKVPMLTVNEVHSYGFKLLISVTFCIYPLPISAVIRSKLHLNLHIFVYVRIRCQNPVQMLTCRYRLYAKHYFSLNLEDIDVLWKSLPLETEKLQIL